MMLKTLLVRTLPMLAVLWPAAAHADHLDVPAMLSTARTCLAQVNALRETETFRNRDMRTLLRKLASDIDYAETWSRRDATIAAGYLVSAMDCDSTIAAWVEAHGPHLSPLRRPAVIQAEADWTLDRAPPVRDLSFLTTGRGRPYNPNRMRFQEMAAGEIIPHSR